MEEMFYKRIDKNIGGYRTKDGDAGYDMYATETKILWPLIPRKIKLNMKAEFKTTEYGLITSRSGQGLKGNFVVPGTIDETFRGQMSATMVRLNIFPSIIRKGDRIAQLILSPYIKRPLKETDGELSRLIIA